MKIYKFIYLFLLSLIFFSCSFSGNEIEVIDTKKPIINMTVGFPKSCSVIKKGVPFTFKASFADNRALGSYSVDIHNNFDHHTHSTEDDICDLDPKKKAKNSFKLIETYNILGNPKTFNAEKEFIIGKEFDSGNYHFMLKIVDAEGWVTIKGISIYVK